MQKRMMSPPPRFSGTLNEFYQLYVAPNLPSPEIVEYYHRVLLEYCATPDALFFVRYVRDTERRSVYSTERGDRFVATDNAPAWWMHHMLFHEDRIPANDFDSALATMPTHFHDVRARIPQSINTAGWHVATSSR